MDRIDENKAIARREIEDFEGKGNVSLARELFAADYKLAFGGMPTMDCAGHEQLIGAFRTAFPDLQIRVTEQVAAADRVGNHWVAQGTHRGAFQGIPATDKAVTITGHNVMHIADDRIRAIWGQFDAVGLMAQLGAIPGPVPAYAASDTRSATSSPSARGSADVVRRFIAKFNEGRLDEIDAEYDQNYVLDFPGGPAGAGKQGIRSATTEFRAAFPDLRFAIDDLFDEGERAAWRWTMTGTHKGKLGPVPASGRKVQVPGISIISLREGRIVRDRVRADMVGLLAQIGAIASPST